MTNWEFLIKSRIKEVLCDTIKKLIEAITNEEYSEAENQAINLLWLLKEGKEVDLNELQFSEAPKSDIRGHDAIMSESRPDKR